MSGYDASRTCDNCGQPSPWVPRCGECEVAERFAVEADALRAEIAKLRAEIGAREQGRVFLEAERDRWRTIHDDHCALVACSHTGESVWREVGDMLASPKGAKTTGLRAKR